MKVVVIIFLVEVVVTVLLKFIVSANIKIKREKSIQNSGLTYVQQELQLMSDQYISNAKVIEKMRSNPNSPMRLENEEYCDGFIREICIIRPNSAPENRIVEIVSRKMENM